MSDFIWVEKYRPETIDDCILPQNIKKTFQGFVDSGQIPNMLLFGLPGVGKTTVAKALCKQLGVDCLVINGSDEGRFLDTVRNNAKTFASTVFGELLNRRSKKELYIGSGIVCFVNDNDFMFRVTRKRYRRRKVLCIRANSVKKTSFI